MTEVMKYIAGGAIYWYAGSLFSFRSTGPSGITIAGKVLFTQLERTSYNRRSGPSIIRPDGYIDFTNTRGVSHRTDGPAIIRPDGSREYWVDGIEIPANEFFLQYGVL